MKDNITDFTDYDVRVWGEDVIIHSHDMLFSQDDSHEGFQCNYEESDDKHRHIKTLCEDIRLKFLELDKTIHEI